MKILFVCPRYPFPLLSGDRVRAFHQLDTLAKSHEVFLLCPPAPSVEAEQGLKDWLGHRIHVPQNRLKALGRVATGVFGRTPFQTLAYADGAYRREALSLVRRFDIEVAHVQLVRLAPVLESAPLPRFMDFVDSLSVNMSQLAERSRGPKQLAARIESRRLKNYERAMVREYDAGGITSARDRTAFGDPKNMFVVPQGAPLHDGTPEEMKRPPSRIIFTGRMSYFPNEDAVLWFAKRAFPLVKAAIADAEFVVAGADPGPTILALNSIPGVKVLGFVESIADELLNSTVAIVPMQSGTGMQTKIVEAMAVGTPIVITPQGLGSLPLVDGAQISLADGVEPFAKAVIRLLANRSIAVEQARQARIEVEQKYSWAASTHELLKGYEYAINAFLSKGKPA